LAIIDPEGLFHGARLSACSDEAQYAWPRYFLAANSVARLELDYEKMLSGPLKSLHAKPTREQWSATMREYHDRYLMFIYQADGVIWGQFWTEQRNLRRYTTRDGQRSPAPPKEPYEKWQDEYTTQKALRSAQVFADLLKSQPITVNHRESPRVTPPDVNHRLGGGIGGGIGGGGGDGIGGESPPQIAPKVSPENPPSQGGGIIVVHETSIPPPQAVTEEGLAPQQYASALLEEFTLASNPGVINSVAGVIQSVAKKRGGSTAAAYDWLLAKAKQAESEGAEVNRFWFEDGKFRDGPQNGKRKGKTNLDELYGDVS
jgi:hypothetical protein